MANLFKDVIIKEARPQNVVQIITDNAHVCKAVGMLIEAEFKHIFWTPRGIDGNENVYNECNWITEVVGDVSFIKKFIITHFMALAIFNEFSSLKLLSIGEHVLRQ
jgi:hypothetical protein